MILEYLPGNRKGTQLCHFLNEMPLGILIFRRGQRVNDTGGQI